MTYKLGDLVLIKPGVLTRNAIIARIIKPYPIGSSFCCGYFTRWGDLTQRWLFRTEIERIYDEHKLV